MWGAILVTLLVIVVLELFEMTHFEKTAVEVVDISRESAKLICRAYHHRKLVKKNKENKEVVNIGMVFASKMVLDSGV